VISNKLKLSYFLVRGVRYIKVNWW